MKNRVHAEKRLKVKDLDTLPVGTREDGGDPRFIVELASPRWGQGFTLGGKRLVRTTRDAQGRVRKIGSWREMPARRLMTINFV